MRPIVSKILPFLLILQVSAPLLEVMSVAAQDIQQSKSSDTISSKPENPEPHEPENISAKIEQTVSLKIPDGAPVEIEAPYTINSMDFKANDKISFRVVNPVKVNGITVIEQGAIATARIDKANRGGHFGKAGLFVFTMQSVTAADGSQVPLRAASVRLRGDSKGAKVATQMIITGALLPLIAPVALLHGFKRGKDAFIPAGKRYSVFIDGNPSVMAGSNLVETSVKPASH